jgi:hypothetical protein
MTILKSLNGKIVEMTAEEEATFLQQQQEAQIAIAERETAKQAEATNKAIWQSKAIRLGINTS